MNNSGTSPYAQGEPGRHSMPAGSSSPYGPPQQSPHDSGALPPLAEWWQRLVARIIDGVILGIVYAVLSAVLTAVLVSADGSGVFLVSLLVAVLGAAAYFGYEVFMLRNGGQTVGKKVLGLRVVPVGGHPAAAPLSSDAVVKRAGVLWGPFALSFIPVVGFVAYLAYVVNVLWQFWDKPLHQCLHDKVAGTVVIRVK
ncbi:RDD family protein [Nonomuraea lactucae]|uniref:RDD family protein n=1 Tax=Nonomuraea lactucae TaxID=2249762 RepID=UPI0013B3792A|nr:RDD family protein [Nonomuraea lactucae]